MNIFRNVPVLLLFSTGLIASSVHAQQLSLPRSSPEAQGVSSAVILDFIETADREVSSMHSFMLVRHGHVVAEAWWAPEAAGKPHILWSLSKSFTSIAVGLAVAEGKLSVNDLVLNHFPNDALQEASANRKAMRIRDLLTMNTGHQDEVNWRAAEHWAKAFLEHPVPHRPGTHFRYSTPATYMLSAIVQKVTDETVLDYLTLYTTWHRETCVGNQSTGNTIGGYGLYLRTEDIVVAVNGYEIRFRPGEVLAREVETCIFAVVRAFRLCDHFAKAFKTTATPSC